jgi:hypothetical protein
MEASMLVEGTPGITPGGTALAYSLDQAEELPPAVVQMIAKAVPRWTFKPVLVDGKPVAAKAKVHLRVVASPVGDGSYRVAIRSACFGDQSSEIKRTGRGGPRCIRSMPCARGWKRRYIRCCVWTGRATSQTPSPSR